ncbi:MAG: protein-glutamate O-methyltransferase CheR [Verrucomicrobia bacterium]|nr:protein-glutamate O-methyltransferase CheR [Verrucomicrobiota bacterium]
MTPSISDTEYRFIRDLVYERSRINLGDQKHELVAGRVGKRLRQLGLQTYTQYCQFLKSGDGQEELTDLIDAISTNHTSFFRDPRHFEFLRSQVLPKLVAALPRGHPRKIRVWSAACSSGEEPYSIAVSLADFFSKLQGWSWEIDATDISTRMLAAAVSGIYEAEQVKLPQPEWLRRYFQRGINAYEGHYRVKRELRERVRFHHVNLFQPQYPFPPGFEVAFCRNVMIYFDRPTQQRLIQRITDYLAPGGAMFLGPSESLIGIRHAFRYLAPGIYQKEK